MFPRGWGKLKTGLTLVVGVGGVSAVVGLETAGVILGVASTPVDAVVMGAGCWAVFVGFCLKTGAGNFDGIEDSVTDSFVINRLSMIRRPGLEALD